MEIIRRRRSLTFIIIALVALLPAAAAQAWLDGAEVTGSISGTLDGTEFEWHSYLLDTPEGEQSTASYNTMMDRLYNFTIEGKQGDNWVEGGVAIVFASFGGPFADCPCEFEGEVTYWTTTSIFADIMIDSEAAITITEAELLSDGSYRLAGTAEAQLLYYESLMRPEPSGEPVPVALEFTVDRMMPQ